MEGFKNGKRYVDHFSHGIIKSNGTQTCSFVWARRSTLVSALVGTAGGARRSTADAARSGTVGAARSGTPGVEIYGLESCVKSCVNLNCRSF